MSNIEQNENRKKFLKAIKMPAEEKERGEIDFSNIVINARMQSRDLDYIKEMKSEEKEERQK